MTKKLIIFDLDGVLINSLNNMKYAWKNASGKHNLNIPFCYYKNFIGLPFKKILEHLKIKKKLHTSISRSYNFYSKQKLQNLKINQNKIRFLKKLIKNNYIIALFTSKNLLRTKLILASNVKLFKIIVCPNNKLKGKPHPDGINYIVKKLKVRKKETIFVGDSPYDFKAAKSSKVDYIHAIWGYQNIKIKKNYIISKIEEIERYLK